MILYLIFFFHLVAIVSGATFMDVVLLFDSASPDVGSITGAVDEIFSQCHLSVVCICASASQGEIVTVVGGTDSTYSSYVECLQEGVQSSGLETEFTLTPHPDSNPTIECSALAAPKVCGSDLKCNDQVICGPDADPNQFSSVGGSSPEAITTEATASEAITTEATTSQAITTEATTSEAITTEATTSEAITTEATTSEAITTEATTTSEAPATTASESTPPSTGATTAATNSAQTTSYSLGAFISFALVGLALLFTLNTF